MLLMLVFLYNENQVDMMNSIHTISKSFNLNAIQFCESDKASQKQIIKQNLKKKKLER